MRFSKSAAALAATLSVASAQTSTDCDPTKKTCPQDTGLNYKTFSSDFMKPGANASWTAAAYSTINYKSDGAEFSIDGKKPLGIISIQQTASHMFMRPTEYRDIC